MYTSVGYIYKLPKYVIIEVNGHNRQSRNTLKTAIKYRINQELKYLYIKKQKLNEQLYHLHLICAQNWQESWLYIQVKCTFVGIRLYSVHIFVKLTITRPKSYISRLYFASLQLVDRDAETSSPTSNWDVSLSISGQQTGCSACILSVPVSKFLDSTFKIGHDYFHFFRKSSFTVTLSFTFYCIHSWKSVLQCNEISVSVERGEQRNCSVPGAQFPPLTPMQEVNEVTRGCKNGEEAAACWQANGDQSRAWSVTTASEQPKIYT